MEKQRKNSRGQAMAQVDRVRSLYSAIGEPLPVDVIFELHRHLDSALALARPEPPRRQKEKLKS